MPVLPTYLLGADIVIAVDISSELEDTREFSKGYEIMIRARAASDALLRITHASYADLLIRPNVGHLHWADFSKAEFSILEGEKACRAALPELMRIKNKGFLFRIFSKNKKQKWVLSYLDNLQKAGAIVKI